MQALVRHTIRNCQRSLYVPRARYCATPPPPVSKQTLSVQLGDSEFILAAAVVQAMAGHEMLSLFTVVIAFLAARSK
jgi:hypothetical protein